MLNPPQFGSPIRLYNMSLLLSPPPRIIPQALCTRFGMAIGYYCSPIVLALMVVFLPIGYPLSLLLDCILGAGHGTFFRRAGEYEGGKVEGDHASLPPAELRELVKMHGTHDNEDPLSFDEVLIVKVCG